MDRREKILYHQIHPLKLFTDVSVGFLALRLLWQRKPGWALAVAFGPPLAVSAWLIGRADLEAYKHSRLGKYLAEYMTISMQALRFLGFGVMAGGAWFHIRGLLPLGFALVLLGWLRGLLFPHRR